MASLREEMEKKGAQSNKQRLYLLAVKSLQKSAVNPHRAYSAFRAALAQDCSLMIELLGGEDAVRTAAHGFLHSIAAEMKNQPPPKDHGSVETHCEHVRPAAAGAEAGDQQTGATQIIPVPASALTDTAAGNQPRNVTQSRNVPAAVAHGTDQAAPVTQSTSVRPVREPSKAQRKITGKVRTQIAISLFDKELGGGIKARRATKTDWINFRFKNLAGSYVADRVLTELNWPDDDKTTTEDLVSEEEYNAMYNSGLRYVNSLTGRHAA